MSLKLLIVTLLYTTVSAAFQCQTWPNAKAGTPHAAHIAAWFTENNIKANGKLVKVMDGLAVWDFADMTQAGMVAIVINAGLTAKEANSLAREIQNDAPGFIGIVCFFLPSPYKCTNAKYSDFFSYLY